jgi:photosystem II stability/assembly factor-like uncharacterized protein
MHYLSGVDFCLAAPDVGYACAESNGCFKTTDRGRTWHRLSTTDLEKTFTWKFPRTPFSTLAVHPANPDEVWVGIGFPRRLENTGRRRLPQGLAVSRDGGCSWKHLAGALPQDDMPVDIRILPERPGHIYVGTDRGVYRSMDGGDTFQDIGIGLPKGCHPNGMDAIYDKARQKVVLAVALEVHWTVDQEGGMAENFGGVWVCEDAEKMAPAWKEATGNLRIPQELLSSLPEVQENPWWQAAVKVRWSDFLKQPEVAQLYQDTVLNYRLDPAKFHALWRECRSQESETKRIARMLKAGCKTYLPSFHTIRIDPRDPAVIYVSIFECIPPYGIWKTTDGGQNWHCITRGARAWEQPEWQCYVPSGEKKLNIIQAWTAMHPMNYGTPDLRMGFWDIRKFDLCRTAPDILTFHSHRVTYRSSDGGKEWLDASNHIVDAKQGLFRGAGNSNMCVFDLAFHPKDPNHVLMWMADCGVKFSRDGGRTLQGLAPMMIGSNQWVRGAAFDPETPARFYVAFNCMDWLLKGLRGRYFLETQDYGEHFLNVSPDATYPLPPKQPEFTAMIANLLVDASSPQDCRRFLATHANQYRYYAANGKAARPPEAPSMGVIESLDGGKSWHASSNGLGENKEVVELLATDENLRHLYAAVLSREKPTPAPGGLYESIDSGKTWVEIPTPLQNVTRVISAHGKLYICGGIKASGKKWSNAGGVFVSSDNGKSWECLLGAPLVSQIAVSPTNPSRIYCTVERDSGSLMQSSGMYRSDDSGKTWMRINNGIAGAFSFTCLKYNPGRLNELWVGTYGSGFYRLMEIF